MTHEQLEEFIQERLCHIQDGGSVYFTLERIMQAIDDYTESQLDIYLME
jgi:hypothetical protein